MTTLKAIETRYKGYRFRSRLEARWAVFFDELGIEWEYEKEGFDLGDAGWYLPDFWLPICPGWVEIKGSHPTVDEQWRASELAVQSGQMTLLAWGLPDAEQAWLYVPDTGEALSASLYPVWCDLLQHMLAECTAHRCVLMQKSCAAARAARFEHGETPL